MGIGNNIKLYGHYVAIHIKSIMQYKLSFVFTAFGQFLTSFNIFIGIYFMFQRFSSVGGYTYSEILLCFSIVLMEFSLAESVGRGFDLFPRMVKSGGFDRVLVRPRGTIIQVLGSAFEISRCARIVQAIVMFIYGISNSHIQWSIGKVMTVLFMLIGGIAVFFGIFLLYAAFCFYTIEGLEFMNIFIDGAREYGKYPVEIYGKRMLQFCTFIIPYSLIQYYPLLYLLDKDKNKFLVAVPLLAILFLIPCYGMWWIGTKKYQSTGS